MPDLSNWPAWKKETYNEKFATSAHAKKLNTCKNNFQCITVSPEKLAEVMVAVVHGRWNAFDITNKADWLDWLNATAEVHNDQTQHRP